MVGQKNIKNKWIIITSAFLFIISSFWLGLPLLLILIKLKKIISPTLWHYWKFRSKAFWIVWVSNLIVRIFFFGRGIIVRWIRLLLIFFWQSKLTLKNFILLAFFFLLIFQQLLLLLLYLPLKLIGWWIYGCEWSLLTA